MDVNNLLSQSYSEQLERNDFPYWTLSGLFTSLKPKLIEMGYSEIDLKKITVYKEECALNINELSEMNKDKLQRQLDCEKLKAEMDKEMDMLRKGFPDIDKILIPTIVISDPEDIESDSQIAGQ